MTPVEWLEARFDRALAARAGQPPEPEPLYVHDPGRDWSRWPTPWRGDDLDRPAADVAEVPEVGYLSRAFDTIVETP